MLSEVETALARRADAPSLLFVRVLDGVQSRAVRFFCEINGAQGPSHVDLFDLCLVLERVQLKRRFLQASVAWQGTLGRDVRADLACVEHLLVKEGHTVKFRSRELLAIA